MSENVGRIGWIDMTTDDASGVRDFYQAVVGWRVEDTSMGDYSDYAMMSPAGGKSCVIEGPSGAVSALYPS